MSRDKVAKLWFIVPDSKLQDLWDMMRADLAIGMHPCSQLFCTIHTISTYRVDLHRRVYHISQRCVLASNS
jgi:hypothetical protein